jgi:hypothetical protein
MLSGGINKKNFVFFCVCFYGLVRELNCHAVLMFDWNLLMPMECTKT